MLSYIALCCGLLCVQAHMCKAGIEAVSNENCSFREIISSTNNLLEENFENCNCSQINSCLCLPIRWNGCELSCFVDGFQRMKETLKVSTETKEKINRIHRLLKILKKKQCANFQSCMGPCLPTATGNVKEFLMAVKTVFQKAEKQKGTKN